MTQVLGIDIGGTKTAIGIVDEARVVTHSVVAPTASQGTEEEMWGNLSAQIDNVLDSAGQPQLEGVGVGAAGPMVWPEGLLSPVNIPAWRDFPIKRRLQAKLPGLTIRIHNDAIALAAAEHWKGAGKGHANMIGMVVSTGVGGGIIADGRVIDGGFGNAGHIGHIVVDPNGPECRCGGRGCLEAIARGPATAQWALDQGWAPSDGNPPDAKTLASDARAGDEVAIAAYRRSGEAVGIALASAAALLDMDIAVIGGGLIQSGSLLLDPIHDAFERHAKLPFAARMRIVPAALNQDAGIVGGASLVLQGDNYWSPDDDA